MKQVLFILSLSLLLISCEEQVRLAKTKTVHSEPNLVVSYQLKHPDSTTVSKSFGNVAKGHLENGKLMPFSGKNYFYFDTSSYLEGRAFVHQKVKQCCLDTYDILYQLDSLRCYGIMECSNKNGGKIEPHRTHQNGLSVDFMCPNQKNGKIYSQLDHIGIPHYMLSYTENGCYVNEHTVTIDFEAIALHLLELNKQTKKHGLKIEKVIFKLELLDELFSGENGKKLRNSGIYFARKLSPLINNLHDDHYHVDFGLV